VPAKRVHFTFLYAPFSIFTSKLYKLQITEEDSHMAWNKDHNILFGMIEINNRDVRNEEIEGTAKRT